MEADSSFSAVSSFSFDMDPSESMCAENAALPHGSGTDRALGKEDMILIDAGGNWGDYVADITRVSQRSSPYLPIFHSNDRLDLCAPRLEDPYVPSRNLGDCPSSPVRAIPAA